VPLKYRRDTQPTSSPVGSTGGNGEDVPGVLDQRNAEFSDLGPLFGPCLFWASGLRSFFSTGDQCRLTCL
jgi:hypothetical protein